MRSRPAGSPRVPRRGSRGFSLVEVLVTLVVVGVVGAGVVGVLLGQYGFYGQSDDRTYAQQSLRAGADLISTELRMADPADVLAAVSDSISVRFDVWRAVVCQSSQATGTATVFVYDSVESPNVPSGFRGYAFSDPYSEAWDNEDAPPLSLSPGSGQITCESRGAPAGRASWRYRTISGWLLPGAFDSVPDRGAVVTRYGRLTYRLEASSFDEGGLAVWRNRQELVSPFERGAAFSYVMVDGTVQSSVAPADRRDVRAVRLVGTALGQGENRYGVDSELRLDARLQE